MVVLWVALCLIAAGASSCTSSGIIRRKEHPPRVVLSGEGWINASGALEFVLDDELECEKTIDVERQVSCAPPNQLLSCLKKESFSERLSTCDVEVTRLTLTPAWAKNLAVTVKLSPDDVSAIFPIDWQAVAVDPRAEDVARKLQTMRWTISSESATAPLMWQPDESDVQFMLAAIARAKGIDTDAGARQDERETRLVIQAFGPEDGRLFAGAVNRLNLAVLNEGPGVASGVVATLRSSHPLLHGLELSLGRIEPGKVKQGTIKVALTPAQVDTSAMVVVVVQSSREKEAATRDQRFSISKSRPKPNSPQLSLSCKLGGRADGMPSSVQPGQDIAIVCEVKNDGRVSASRVSLKVEALGKSAERTLEGTIAARQKTSRQVAFRIPTAARPGNTLKVTVSANAQDMKKPISTTLEVDVVESIACPRGYITREEYQRKIVELRKLLEDGVLTQKELDRYEADLVRCLR